MTSPCGPTMRAAAPCNNRRQPGSRRRVMPGLDLEKLQHCVRLAPRVLVAIRLRGDLRSRSKRRLRMRAPRPAPSALRRQAASSRRALLRPACRRRLSWRRQRAKMSRVAKCIPQVSLSASSWSARSLSSRRRCSRCVVVKEASRRFQQGEGTFAIALVLGSVSLRPVRIRTPAGAAGPAVQRQASRGEFARHRLAICATDADFRSIQRTWAQTAQPPLRSASPARRSRCPSSASIVDAGRARARCATHPCRAPS